MSTGARGGGHVRLALDPSALARDEVAIVAADTAGARTFVGCGPVLAPTQIEVVDPDTRERCRAGAIGELWLGGPGIARGYWGKPELTAEVFGARIAPSGDGPFLRSGDLGFVHDGEVYITGRLKDLLIARGRNLYPQDLELTAEHSHPALRPGCAAAFSVDVADEERIALVIEVDPKALGEPNDVLWAIREAVARDHDVQLHAVALLAPGGLQKTSSGKVQRRATRLRFTANQLDALAIWQSQRA